MLTRASSKEIAMFRCLNPGAIGVNLPWDQCLPLACKYGFEGIDVGIDPAVPAAKITNALAQHSLKIGGTGLPVSLYGDDKAYDTAIVALQAIAARAAEIGVTRFATWILPFSDARPFTENVAWHAQRLGRAARVLARHGCRLGLEFIGPKTVRVGHKYPFVRTMEHMLELADAVGPNAGLLLDSWHWYTSLGTVEDILALAPEQVVYVHINDAPAGVPVDAQKDNVRCLPGETGVEDLKGFLAALRKIGYDGPVVPEPFVKELASLPGEEAIRRVGEALKRIW
jgi:sugar phosphate isomerase/epimerase